MSRPTKFEDTATDSLPQEEVKNVVSIIQKEIRISDHIYASSQNAGPIQAWYNSKRFLELRKHRLGDADAKEYNKRVREQLECIKWRFCAQEPFYMAVVALAKPGLLKIDKVMAGPINMASMSRDESFVEELLKSYSFCLQCSDDEHFMAPVQWLAKIIVRSCASFEKLTTLLDFTRIFGAFDECYKRRVVDTLGQTSFAVTTTTETSSEEVKDREDYIPPFAIWLPLNMKYTKEFDESWRRRYMHTQSVYKRCFGPGSWGDTSSIREAVQISRNDCQHLPVAVSHCEQDSRNDPTDSAT